MHTQTIEMTQLLKAESYQMIKDEHLVFVVISSQILAGSRVLLSTYLHVVFSNCNFYACDFQGVTFENCVFENCSFEFSHFRKSKFKNCNFTNCIWKASSTINSVYEDCDLSPQQVDLCASGNNVITHSRHDYSTDIYIEMALAS